MDKAVHVSKLEALQSSRPVVYCGESALENVFIFLYLGTIFTANGLHFYDVAARVAMAMSRCGKLHNIFDSPHIPLKVKLWLYEAAVCSLLTYGCETWDLDTPTIRKINGANSAMLARITDRSIQAEVRPLTTSYNHNSTVKKNLLLNLKIFNPGCRDGGRKSLGWEINHVLPNQSLLLYTVYTESFCISVFLSYMNHHLKGGEPYNYVTLWLFQTDPKCLFMIHQVC